MIKIKTKPKVGNPFTVTFQTNSRKKAVKRFKQKFPDLKIQRTFRVVETDNRLKAREV